MQQLDDFKRIMGRMSDQLKSKIDTRAPVSELRKVWDEFDKESESFVPPMGEVRQMQLDLATGRTAARLYTPIGAGTQAGPAFIFYHGGGFVIGDLNSHDIFCRRLADAAKARVIAIDYRRAPENRFPAAAQDALAAWDWVSTHCDELQIDPDFLMVAGDSAGGNLASVVAQQRKSAPIRPFLQLLIYPFMQLADTQHKRHSALHGAMAGSAVMDYFVGSYLNHPSEALDPMASPLFQTDLEGLAPAYIITAGLDPLHEEGEVYAAKLRAHGNFVKTRHYPKMVHGFMSLTGILPSARDAFVEIGDNIRNIIRGQQVAAE